MTTRIKKRWSVALIAVLVAAGVSLLLRGRSNDGATTTQVASGDAATSSHGATPSTSAGPAANGGKASASRACTLKAGQTLSYAINIAGSSTLPAAMLGQDPKAAPITMPNSTTLSLDLQALGATAAHSTVLLAHYRDLHSTLLESGSTMAAPFLLRLSDSCELTGFARLSSTAKAYARTQQSIAHELLWTWPEQNGAEVHGENGYGPYLARYSVQSQGAVASVTREVLSYDTFWEEEHGGRQRLDVIPHSSQAVVTVDAGPWFKSWSGHELLAGKNTAFDTRVSASRMETPKAAFDGLSHDPAAYQWEDLLPQQFNLRIPRPVTGADLQARALVKHYSPQQSVERFMKRSTDGTPFHQRWPELTTYLEARPDQTSAVVDQLKKGVVSQEAAPAFYVALGRARTPESLAALYDIMQSESSPLPERVRAAFAMIDRDDVGVSLAQDFAKHAAAIDERGSKIHRVFAREVALAAGALSGLHEEDTAMRTVVMDMAKSILQKSNDAILVRPAYGALANMGDPSALPIADDAFAHGSPEMRAAAAVVVRRMSPKDTSDTVARWLAAETDWNVKRAIYSVVSRQMADIQLPASAALVAQAAKDLQTDPGNITRKAIIHILGRSVDASHEARAALMQRLPLELKKGKSSMYAAIASFLTPEETREAIHHAI